MIRRPGLDERPPAPTFDKRPTTPPGPPLETSAWEANELRRHWSNALRSLADVVDRCEEMGSALAEPDGLRRIKLDPLAFGNTAQRLAEAASEVATLLALYDGIVHRHALARHEPTAARPVATLEAP